MEPLLKFFWIITPLCMGLTTTKSEAEYGPVYENEICAVNFFKTSICKIVELDFFEDEYCCKKCSERQENLNPEYSNTCTDIPDQPATSQSEFPTTTTQISTTDNEIPIPATNESSTSLPDDSTTSVTTTAVSYVEEIVTEQGETTGYKIDPPLSTKKNYTNIALVVFFSVVILILAVVALDFFYKLKKSKQNTQPNLEENAMISNNS